MTIFFKIYSDVGDIAAISNTTATYANARNSTIATAGATNTSNYVGQDFSGGFYTCAQLFLQFNLSAVPAGGTGFLEINCPTWATVAGDTLEVHQASAKTNKIAGGSIAGLPSLATAIAMPTSSGHKQFTLTADPARSATSYLLLSSGKESASTAPAGTGERALITMADNTGTTNDPFIQILTGTLWDFVAAGTSVEATATSHILTEPAGVAAGDLLVACIGSRIASTTQITLPSGWTRVGQQLNNNTLSTSSALPSGMMAYIVRGASPPSYTFTHPVAPNVALGRVVAYRNVHQTAPLDSGVTQATTATAITAVSVAGLTTTADDDLIVALTAGGQEGTWSAFNATDPGTSSSTTADSVLDPIWGQWLERAEQVTGTGNDTSLAVFDAVKQTAGATGNLTATASLQAGHVVVAGSFRRGPIIVLRSQTSTSYVSTTNTVLAAPAGIVNGDILIATIVCARSAATPIAPTPPAGFTAFGTNTAVIDASDFRGNLYVFWKRAASESGSYTFTHGAQNTQGLLQAYAGCVASGTPLGATANNTGVGNTSTGTGITTTAANSLLLYLAHDWTGSGTLTPPTGMSERFDGLLYSADQLITSPGATGNKTQTTANDFDGPWAVRMVELLETTPAPTGTTYNETVAETATAAETLALLTESKVRETEAADWRETEDGNIRITEGDFFIAPPIEASVAESAPATDTVAATLAYTKAVAETATATDTTATTLTRAGAIAETAAAVETVTGPLTGAIVVAETVNAIETLTASLVSAPGVFDETVIETAAAVDTVSKTLILTSAIAENAGANETVSNTALRSGALAESTSATDTSTGLLTRIGAVAETASAAETIAAGIVPAAAGMMVVETAPVVDTTVASAIFTRAIVETASAAETIGKALSLTIALAETAAAAETVAGLRVGIAAIVESTSVGRLTEAGDWRETEAGVPRGTASTIDTTSGLLIGTTAIVESAAAAETITYSLTGAAGSTYSEVQAEVAAAAEVVTGRLGALGAIAESASAAETTTRLVSYTRAIVETAAAAETIGKTVSYTRAVVESASAAETIGAAVVPAAGVFSVSIAETVSAADTVGGALVRVAAIVETAAAAETIGAAVIGLPQIIDVTVAESASAVDTLTADIRRWTPEPPPWNAWIKEATASAAWTRTPSASGLWSPHTPARERITTYDFLRITDDGQIRITDGVNHYDEWQKQPTPANRWTKE